MSNQRSGRTTNARRGQRATKKATKTKAATRKSIAGGKAAGRTAASKASSRKAAAARPPSRKAATKKAVAKKAAPKTASKVSKKVAVKKAAAPKKSVAKTPSKKATATKKVAAKAPSKKAMATKRVAAKKAAKKKAAKKKVAAKKVATKTKKAAAEKRPATKTTAKRATSAPSKKSVAKKSAQKEKAPSKKAAVAKSGRSAREPEAPTKAKTRAARPSTGAGRTKPQQGHHLEPAPSTKENDAPMTSASSTPRRVIRRRRAESASAEETPAAKAPSVIRVGPGERTPNRGKPGRGRGPQVEINPKLESSRELLPRAQGHVPGGRPQSFAERVRAEAEAAFQRIAPAWKEEETKAPEPEPLKTHRSQFEIRISEQDSLTTQLRVSEGKKALEAARELASRYRLPPDQSLLLKVVALRNTELTRLALEELLELDDRGRVRSNPELIETLKGIRTRDREIRELRELFLEKLGG